MSSTTRGPALLELSGVDAGHGDLLALHFVTLAVGAGEVVAVVGANGAGKTTMLRTVSGLIAPRSGEIRVEGSGAELLGSERVARAYLGM